MDERGGEVEAALHAAGVLADAAVGVLGQVDHIEQIRNALFDLAARHVVEARGEAQHFAPGLEHIEARFLQRHADRLAHIARLLEHIKAADPSLALSRPEQRGQHSHRRRLARAVLPQEAEDLPAPHAQVDPVDGVNFAEVFGQPIGADRELRVRSMLMRGLGKLVNIEVEVGGGRHRAQLSAEWRRPLYARAFW